MASSDFSKPAKVLTKKLSERARPIRSARKGLVAQASAAAAPARNDLLPEMTLRTLSIDALKMPATLTRKVLPGHVADVADSIRVHGLVRYPLADPGLEVIDGWIIVEACKLLGMKTITCLIVSHLRAAELRILRLSLNRLQEKGEWDIDQLQIEFRDLLEQDMPLEHTGFSAPEIDLILLQDT
jgi:hypothetical protein